MLQKLRAAAHLCRQPPQMTQLIAQLNDSRLQLDSIRQEQGSVAGEKAGAAA